MKRTKKLQSWLLQCLRRITWCEYISRADVYGSHAERGWTEGYRQGITDALGLLQGREPKGRFWERGLIEEYREWRRKYRWKRRWPGQGREPEWVPELGWHREEPTLHLATEEARKDRRRT